MGDDLFRSSIHLPQMERDISPDGGLLIGVTEFTMCRLIHLSINSIKRGPTIEPIPTSPL